MICQVGQLCCPLCPRAAGRLSADPTPSRRPAVAIGKQQPEVGNLALAILRIFQEQQSRRWRR